MQDLAADQTVLVMGDLNTTEREPAYADFTAGLQRRASGCRHRTGPHVAA